MMQSLASATAGVVLAAAIAGAATAQAQSPVGRWMTEGGKSHVQIYPCGPHLCGRIAWLREPLAKDGLPKVDLKNPDPAQRSRRILGLNFMWNFAKSEEPGEWEGGRIYNPEDGDVYKARMKLRPDGKLEMRGYVGISLLGRTQYWERVR